MDETKKWWQSATIWGAVISVVSKIVMIVFGIEITGAEVAHITDAVVVIISTITGLIGDFVAIVGRKKASTKIA